MKNSKRTNVETLSRACADCGQATDSPRAKVVGDPLREGAERVFGWCAECADAPTGELSAQVLTRLFDLESGDPAALALPVERFSDLPTRSPEQPSAAPWAHLNRDQIAREIATWRALNGALKGGPCSYCGMEWTAPGTRWRTWTGSQSGSQCGKCQERFSTRDPRSDEGRSYAAAVLCGFERGSSVTVPRLLGQAVEFLYWHETAKRKPNSAPFAHLNVRAMREKVARLADQRAIRLPPKWDSSRVVEW